MTHYHEGKLAAAFRRLYPELSEEELARAQANFDRFLELVVRITGRELEERQRRKMIPENPEQQMLF